ncbi:hypothetical protein BLOT_016832 [Blomia tropicalis]|nr:hypothetical protein BLOT_016832 [Blomia tropicalis]
MDKTEENLWRITSSLKEYTIKNTDISCDVTCDPKCIRCETNQSSNDKRLNCDKKLTPQK